jgi:hypothetical protein
MPNSSKLTYNTLLVRYHSDVLSTDRNGGLRARRSQFFSKYGCHDILFVLNKERREKDIL